MKKFSRFLVPAALLAAPAISSAALSIAPLTSFGGGDGWRAPNEVVVGDTAGTATGSNYNYLSTGALERGLAYNPATGNLVLVSRSGAGNGLRVLSGTSGADAGFLPQGSGIITGGTFTTSTVGIGGDGQIYVANLTANVGTSAYKVYRWTSEAASAPTTYFNATIAGFAATPRLGDSLDVIGSGASTKLVAGTSGSTGYAVITGSGGQAVSSFTPTGVAAGEFRLGVTFAGSDTDVWGKQTGANAGVSAMRRTTYGAGAVGSFLGSSTFVSGGEAALDYAVIAGTAYLATLDINSSIVRIYNMTNPALPSLILSGTTTTGLLTATGQINNNGNGVGSVKWGAIDDSTQSATLYAMSTNQGIQAFTISVPEPSALGMLALAVPALARRRRA